MERAHVPPASGEPGINAIGKSIAGLRTAGIKRAIMLVAADNPQGHQFWVRHGWEDIQGALPMTREI
jgi:hypothetical protein